MSVNLFPLPDFSATEKLATQLVPLLQRGDMLALQGSLGAGKTTFARYLLQVLGFKGEVPSPTFTLVQSYDTEAFPIYHFDLYRLKSPVELEELGWEDAFADGLVILEWPERAETRLPEQRLELHFEINEQGQRQCRIKPMGHWIERLRKIK